MATSSYAKPHCVGFEAERSNSGNRASFRSRRARASSVSFISHAVRAEKRGSILMHASFHRRTVPCLQAFAHNRSRGFFMSIRAVIFDYGMVLSHPQEPAALGNLLTITGLDRDTFESHYWTHRLAYDMGRLNGRSYWQQLASDSGIELTATDVERLIENDVLMWC